MLRERISSQCRTRDTGDCLVLYSNLSGVISAQSIAPNDCNSQDSCRDQEHCERTRFWYLDGRRPVALGNITGDWRDRAKGRLTCLALAE